MPSRRSSVLWRIRGMSRVFYPLKDAVLERKYAFAVSNEITADAAEISLSKGILLVIESRD